MTSTSFCRNHLRKEILSFSKGKDLKKGWKIEKKVRYNDKEYPNKIGLKCDDENGIWKMGSQISPDGNGGYYMIDYTIVGSSVDWNTEYRFNSKMTCVGGWVNYFTYGKSKFMSGKEMCDECLKPYIEEGGLRFNDGFIFT